MKSVKKFVLFFVLFFQFQLLQAQFTKANLQATGLTCAMCSNAINKALQHLPFVESVKADIKNSSFSIVFRQQAPVDLDAIKNAVEEAGFFVGGLQVTGSFNNLNTGRGGIAKIGNSWFYFVKDANRVLQGEVTIKLQDKSFLTAKEFKKISTAVKLPSLQTGKAETDLATEGLKKGERLYHVTI